MNPSTITTWATSHPYVLAATVVVAAVLAAALRRSRKNSRTPGAVLVAAFGAIVCTAYSADTSWNFARDHLGMASASERIMMFAAAEVGLFAMALMARANLNDPDKSDPGTPGVLVWVVTGVQVIPAFSESGIVAGTVRAFVGPVMAALLWHLAMGIELRHAKPGTLSNGLLAIVGRELRERLLSRLGLAVRDRTAEQISRDRATQRAVRYAAKLAANPTGRGKARTERRLAAAVARAHVGDDPEQRRQLMTGLAARRGAKELATIDLQSPWEAPAAPKPEPVPVELERVPDPVPAVPEAVPGGVHPERQQYRLDSFAERLVPVEPQRVLAAEPPRTRPEVHAEYVPEDEPEDDGPDPEDEVPDDSPPPPGEDTLTARAREYFHDEEPSVRRIKDVFHVGQKRAQRIRDELLKVSA
ncbi:hypothetical protein ACFYOY_14055 [Streptomyces sp. NPDC007875]|uniref:hypothetical protein n=1 Tax=Streptomyces sp. NPDC007875 TaxID=3364783 RepID=UPI00368414B6